MTKPIKIVLGAVSGLLLLVLLGLVIAVVSIDSIARRGVEAGASYALGVPTTLQKADVGIASGSFSMSGLQVSNPKGFDGDFLKLGNATMAVSLGSLSSDTVVLPKFQISDLDLDLARSATGANYQAILDNLKRLESGQKPKEPSQPGKKFKIKEVLIDNVTVHVSLAGGALGSAKATVPIHEIKLTDVGNDGAGVDIATLTSTILQAVLQAAVEKGGGIIPGDIANELKGNLAQLNGLANVGVAAVGKAGEQLTKLEGDLGKTEKGVEKGIQDAQDQFKKGLGGLLPGSKAPEKKPGDK